MFSHIVVGSSDIERSRRFYDAIFAAIGGAPGRKDVRGWLIYAHNGGRFVVAIPKDGEPATHANGGTIGFLMSGPEQADAWHAAGVAHGGTAIEDPPGVRHATENRTLYLAYLRDPDGNKLCGFHNFANASAVNPTASDRPR